MQWLANTWLTTSVPKVHSPPGYLIMYTVQKPLPTCHKAAHERAVHCRLLTCMQYAHFCFSASEGFVTKNTIILWMLRT